MTVSRPEKCCFGCFFFSNCFGVRRRFSFIFTGTNCVRQCLQCALLVVGAILPCTEKTMKFEPGTCNCFSSILCHRIVRWRHWCGRRVSYSQSQIILPVFVRRGRCAQWIPCFKPMVAMAQELLFLNQRLNDELKNQIQ